MSGRFANVRLGGAFLLLTACLASCACEWAPRPHASEDADSAKIVVVLVDRSASTQGDRAIYERATAEIVEKLRGGDRFVMGPITSASGTDFAASIDHELPRPLEPMGIFDEPIEHARRRAQHEAEVARTASLLEEQVAALLGSSSRAERTAIVESLRVVQPFFESEPRRKRVLVVLSDMVEDSEIMDLGERRPDGAWALTEVDRQRADGSLPRLSGVTVHVYGALASPPSRAAGLEAFWREYLAATGANVGRGRYARVLTSFQE